MQRNEQKFDGSRVTAAPTSVPWTVRGGSPCSTPSPARFVSCLFSAVTVTGVRWYFFMVLICFSLTMSDGGHLFTYLLTICMSSLKKMSIQVLRPFLNWVTWFFTIELHEFLIYIGYHLLIKCVVCKCFLPFSDAIKSCVPHNYPLSQLNFWSSANYCLTVIYFMYF